MEAVLVFVVLFMFGWGTSDFFSTIIRSISGGYLELWHHILVLAISLTLIFTALHYVDVVVK